MSTPKRPGSSPCIEFFISLVVGVLAVVGGLFIIGFLLVEPTRYPPGQRSSAVEQECEPTLRTKLLPNGCTHNGMASIQEGVCSNRECTCDQADTNVCCCRGNEHQRVDNLVCPTEVATPTITNTTSCGCGSCDDVTIHVHITVVDRDSEEPIPAALVLHIKEGEEPRFAGLTSNNGLLMITELAGNMHIELKVIASGYAPYIMMPMRLHPHVKVVTLHVPMIPSMNVELGLGGSEVILRLGSMASATAPAGSFHPMDDDKEVYEDLIRFKGTFVTPGDASGLTGVPGTTFNVVNKETGEEETMGVLFVTMLEFVSEDGTPLTTEQLLLRVSLINEDGQAPPLYLIVYNETARCWEKHSNFTASPNAQSTDSRKKRQSIPPLILENENTPLGVFAAVASSNNIQCWLQGRSFDSAGVAVSGPFITMEHRLDVSGSTFLVRFGTNTGAHQTSGVVANGVCLPVDCGPYIDAIVTSREAFSSASNPLIPVPFPPDTFNITENAPIIFGSVFSFEEHIAATTQRRRPFYNTQQDCVLTGADPNAPGSSYFSFNQGTIEFPEAASDSCFLKIQIRDCFLGNDVTITSINPDTGIIEQTNTVTVIETEDFTEEPSVSGTEPTLPVTTPGSDVCDDSTATLRAACLPFVCGSNIQLIVRPNIDSGRTTFCEITQRSVFLSNPLISEVSNNLQLILRSSQLATDDFNNPDLGLYYTAGNNEMAVLMTEELCNAGDGNSTSSFIDVMAGAAVEFSCF